MTDIGLNKRYSRVHCPEKILADWWLCLMQAMSFSRWSRLPGWHKNNFWQKCCWKYITEMTYDTREDEAHLWKWKKQKICLLSFKDYRITHSIAIDFTIFCNRTTHISHVCRGGHRLSRTGAQAPTQFSGFSRHFILFTVSTKVN
jgi:hypothetical protein